LTEGFSSLPESSKVNGEILNGGEGGSVKTQLS